MLLLTRDIPRRRAYRLLIGSIVPRPIAWVSSLAADGSRNLAPFSYFMGIGSDPPLLAVSVNAHRGARKDTLQNAEETGEIVVNIANEALLDRMVLTSGLYASGTDEFEIAGFTPAPCELVKPPRVAEAPISMECRVTQITMLGNAPNMTGVIFAEVVAWHLDDAILDADQLPDMHKLGAVGRMIDDRYILTRELRDVPRPTLDERSAPRMPPVG